MNENNRCQFKLRAAAIAVASCLISFPWAAQAASLGKLTVFSGLGQPLRAEVEISGEKDELPGMTARLAPAEVFKQASVEYASGLTDLRFAIEKKSGGRAVLKVTSVRPVNEPFLDFLIELNWPAGKLVREYTFLLDPPEYATQQNARTAADARIVETVQGGGAVASAKPAARVPAEARAAAGVSVAKPAKPAPAPAKPATEGNAYVVERGDTLRKIASLNQYEGVSLEQMLVGLYRNNRDAFIGNDINRLKAGAILNLPEKSAVEAVTAKETRSIYVQTGDFGAYRNKLAAAASKSETAEAPAAQQQTGGKITPKVEEKTPALDPAKDQLKVARTDASGKASAAAEADRVAREKALKEAEERVTLLEKNVGELQKLLEMKNQRLAELEKQPAGDGAKPPVAPSVSSAESVKPEAEKPVAQPVAEEKPVTPVEPVQQKTEEKPKTPSPVLEQEPVVDEPGMLDSVLEDPLPLVGGVGALALLAGLFAYRRRKSNAPLAPETTAVRAPSSLGPNSVFRMTGGQSVDTGNTPPQTGEFSQAGPGTIDTDEVDPVAEADVYMAYGRDAQAEEILLEALQKDPQRLAIHAKLLEIYANRRSLKQFETLASELYAQTAGIGPEWEKVSALGAELDPRNPLYQAKLKSAGAETVVASSAVAAAALTAAADEAGAVWQSDVPAPAPTVVEPLVADVPLNVSAIDAAPAVPESTAEVSEPQALDPMNLDFEFAVKPAAEEAVVAPAAEEAGFDEPYVDTVVTGEQKEAPVEPENAAEADLDQAMDAIDFDLSGMVGGDEPANVAVSPDVAQVAPSARAVESPLDELPALEIDAVSADESLPDFSPAGTLVMPGAMSDSEIRAFGLSELAEAAPAAVPEPEVLATEVPEAAAQTVVNTQVTPMVADDLDFDHPDMVSTVVNPGAPIAAQDAGDDVDFDVKLSDSVFLGQPMMPSDFDIGSINLDLSEPPAAPAPAEVPPVSLPPAYDAHWEEVNTKLDLAKAYEEMGDLEGARELLQEVVGEGSEDLVTQASDILNRIGG